MDGSPSWWSGSGRVSISENKDALTEVQEWSGGPPGGPGLVERPSQRSGSGQEALPKVREWSGGPLGGPGVVGRPSQRSGSGREARPVVRQ